MQVIMLLLADSVWADSNSSQILYEVNINSAVLTSYFISFCLLRFLTTSSSAAACGGKQESEHIQLRKMRGCSHVEVCKLPKNVLKDICLSDSPFLSLEVF